MEELLKQRPAYMPSPTHLWENDLVIAQTKEHHAQLQDHLSKIGGNKKKLQQWQLEICRLEELQSKGMVIHSLTWETKQREKESIAVEKQHLDIGLERLEYKVKLSGERLFANFESVVADFHASYISQEVLVSYLTKYQHLLQITRGVVLFTEDATSKIQAVIDKYLPT